MDDKEINNFGFLGIYSLSRDTGRLTIYLMQVKLGGTTTRFFKWGQKISERRSRVYEAEITHVKTIFSGIGIQGVKKRDGGLES